MLKKGFRLRKKEDFDRVFRSGKPLFFSEIGCRYLIGTLPVRLGFSLSKKHLPSAVARNRVRRVLSEAFFQSKTEWPATGDIVFFTTEKLTDIGISEGRTIINHLLESLKKVKK